MRELALRALASISAARAIRIKLSTMPSWTAVPSPKGQKHRLVYSANNGSYNNLPGILQRSEGQKKHKDATVNEAYDFSGDTYDFYKIILGRNSLDNKGMSLISTVHFERQLNNAFWDGEQMCYGDGDGSIFTRFTKSLDVVGHELTHGVVSHTCNLEYSDESGALNEHFADVFGVLVKQWKKKQTAKQADWLIGSEIMGPKAQAKSIRTFKAEKAYEDDPYLGTDPQPKHMRSKYKGSDDNGGVHINSGIPNHAFYLVSVAIGGKAWERAGRIWYEALLRLTATSDFADMVITTSQAASRLFGSGSKEQKAVASAWKKVGL